MMAIFQIKTEPSEQAMRKRISPARPITCPIHITVEDFAFPNAQWDDFAVVILASWVEQVGALKRGEIEDAVLRFMDGPYEVNVTPASADFWLAIGVIRGLDVKEIFREVLQSDQVLAEVVRASRQLLGLVRKAGIWDDDCDKLEAMVNRIAC